MEKDFIDKIDEDNLPTFVHPRIFPKYFCNICMELYKEPMRFLCGHIMCKNCFANYKNTKMVNNYIKCATCRVESPNEGITEDKMYLKLLPRLLVHCCNLDKGCMWKGAWINVQDHENSCEALLVPEYLRDCEEEAK